VTSPLNCIGVSNFFSNNSALVAWDSYIFVKRLQRHYALRCRKCHNWNNDNVPEKNILSKNDFNFDSREK
jgi:hypothetical protein